MANRSRIPTNPKDFDSYMERTDNLQLTLVTAPSTYKWTQFGWKDTESQQWTSYRTQCDALFAKYDDPDLVGPAVRRQMKALIKNVRKYDNDKAEGHHLLDLVALHGSVDDCETFNVKRGTILADDPSHGSDDPGMKVPLISLRTLMELSHELSVTDPDTPTSKALPKGMKFAKVYRFIGENEPKSYRDFEFIGNAKRGIFISELNSIELSGSTRLYAFYIARYESNSGILGNPCAILKVPIL